MVSPVPFEGVFVPGRDEEDGVTDGASEERHEEVENRVPVECVRVNKPVEFLQVQLLVVSLLVVQSHFEVILNEDP